MSKGQRPVSAATWDDRPAELRLHRAAAEVKVSAPWREAVEEELAQCSPLRELELAQRRPPVERVVVVVVHERGGRGGALARRAASAIDGNASTARAAASAVGGVTRRV